MFKYDYIYVMSIGHFLNRPSIIDNLHLSQILFITTDVGDHTATVQIFMKENE